MDNTTNPAGSPKVTPVAPFNQFEDLTRELVQVPNKEVKEKEAERRADQKR